MTPKVGVWYLARKSGERALFLGTYRDDHPFNVSNDFSDAEDRNDWLIWNSEMLWLMEQDGIFWFDSWGPKAPDDLVEEV